MFHKVETRGEEILIIWKSTGRITHRYPNTNQGKIDAQRKIKLLEKLGNQVRTQMSFNYKAIYSDIS